MQRRERSARRYGLSGFTRGLVNLRRPVPRGFSLVELLISIAIIALLISLLVPALGSARESARAAACLSNQRQLTLGWALYADSHAGRAMPLARHNGSSMIYWWGEISPGLPGPTVNHERGFLTPFLDASLHERSVYECPSQPWGTYRPQPMGSTPGAPTSTYGYNGYYLSPPMTPGWSASIGHQPWKRLADVESPSDLFVFADTLLPASRPMNNALLDPPQLFANGAWTINESPTTAFRHAGRASPAAITARADGSARAVRADGGWLTHPDLRIGSAGADPGPHYVPDWTRWR